MSRAVLGRPWQDWVFAIGEVVFLVSLLPILFDGNANVPAVTGLVTAAMLYGFLACQISYRNWMTAALTVVTATVWVLIGVGVHI